VELACAAKTDLAAATELFERSFDLVYRYWALRTGDAGAAERYAVAVLETAFQRLHEFPRSNHRLATWLLQLASQSHAAWTPVTAERSDPGPSEFQRRAVARIVRFLGRSDHRTALALTLKLGAGLSLSEVARETNSTPRAVAAAIYRAIAKVRRELECDA